MDCLLVRFYSGNHKIYEKNVLAATAEPAQREKKTESLFGLRIRFFAAK